MKINYNSTSSKLYRWFYDTHRMPETLCPYFWKLVFAWFLTIILSPLLLPTWITRKVTNDFDENVPIGPYAFMGFLIYGMLFIIASVGVFISAYWVTYYRGNILHGMYVGGGITLSIGIVVLITYFTNQLHKKKKQKYKEPKPSILVEFIKAKYHKYCPKIDWEN